MSTIPMIPMESCVGAYIAKGAASYAASKVNLAHPGTNNLTDGTAYPTWDAVNGWAFDGVQSGNAGQYLKTGIIPATGWSALIQYSDMRDDDTKSQTLFGSYGGTTARFIIARNSDAKTYYQNGSFINVTTKYLSGNACIAGQQGYHNGIADGGAIDAWSGTGLEIYIGGYNDGTNKPMASAQLKVQALFVYNVVLSPAQVLAISTVMAAL